MPGTCNKTVNRLATRLKNECSYGTSAKPNECICILQKYPHTILFRFKPGEKDIILWGLFITKAQQLIHMFNTTNNFVYNPG